MRVMTAALNPTPESCYKDFGSLGDDEATHNYDGGDAIGNAASAPRLPLTLALPNRR
jgi:hypothetical protein